jgi:predicted AAA+ superfamily ATPase
MYPRQKTDSMAGANFLMNWGIDLASRPRSGNIFQQAATSAKNPLLQFQQEKLMEQAAGRKETSEDRALLAKMLEGMDDEKLSAMMKDVKKGVEAGYYKDEMEGIRRKLAEDEFGVMDMPGEARDRRISKLEDHYLSIDNKSGAYARDVAEHQYKMETDVYPKLVQDDLSQYPIYIKPAHKARDIKPEYDENGEVTKFVVQGNQDRTYLHGKIFFDPETGNLFKRVSSKGQAPVFQRVDFE